LQTRSILQTLYQGGRIDRFRNGNVFLTNIFGELQEFSEDIFESLLAGHFIQGVHLHIPGGECFKISAAGIRSLDDEKFEVLCGPEIKISDTI
jgi:hypothetical protein